MKKGLEAGLGDGAYLDLAAAGGASGSDFEEEEEEEDEEGEAAGAELVEVDENRASRWRVTRRL